MIFATLFEYNFIFCWKCGRTIVYCCLNPKKLILPNMDQLHIATDIKVTPVFHKKCARIIVYCCLNSKIYSKSQSYIQSDIQKLYQKTIGRQWLTYNRFLEKLTYSRVLEMSPYSRFRSIYIYTYGGLNIRDGARHYLSR